MAVYARNSTLIEAGDTFLFRGIKGQDVAENLLLTVSHLTLEGNLSVTYYHPSSKVQHSFEIPYERAIHMWEQGIWASPEDPIKTMVL